MPTNPAYSCLHNALLARLYVAGIADDGAFDYLEAHVVIDLNHGVLLLDLADFAVNAASDDYAIALFKGVLKCLELFLTLGLWANHEEIENHDDEGKHQDGHGQTLCRLTLSLQHDV